MTTMVKAVYFSEPQLRMLAAIVRSDGYLALAQSTAPPRSKTGATRAAQGVARAVLWAESEAELVLAEGSAETGYKIKAQAQAKDGNGGAPRAKYGSKAAVKRAIEVCRKWSAKLTIRTLPKPMGDALELAKHRMTYQQLGALGLAFGVEGDDFEASLDLASAAEELESL